MAAIGPHRPVEMDDIRCAGGFQQSVDVLCDVDHGAAGEGLVRSVGLGCSHGGAPI